MTDNEIIKALECCGEANNCIRCEYEPTKYRKGTIGCSNELVENAIDLIKRQQEEINTLFEKVERFSAYWKADVDEYEICATEFTCSKCNESFASTDLTDTQFTEMMKYCPNCGAKMKGVKEE